MALAQDRFILTPTTPTALPTLASTYGLTVIESVDNNGQTYVVTGPANVSIQDFGE